MDKIRVVFMGTPEFSVPVLQGLIDNYNVVGVVTQPDKEVGRHKELEASPIKKLAEKYNIPVVQPIKVRNEYQCVLDFKPDIVVTCAYGQIIPTEILDYPKYKCVNVHASLLPKYRGGAPIHHAIMDGEKETGITIMYMAPGMDDGDIITQSRTEITSDDTAASLHDKLSKLGSELLIETLPSIFNGTNVRTKQNDSEVTYAPIIKPEDEKIDFSRTSREIYNQIRGLNSFPGAYALFEGKRIKIWKSVLVDEYYSQKLNGEIVETNKDGIIVKTGNSTLLITELQPEGKSRMRATDFVNGYKDNLIGKLFH
jgi:methionyl-tRNA formyltransferase